jgi:CRISPR-associated endoribonuclease Cas6
MPQWWGRAAQMALLKAIAELDETLAKKLHDDTGLRPYTASSLLGRFPRKKLDLLGSYTLRFTGLTAVVSETLLRATTEGAFAVGRTLELDFFPFEVTAVYRSKEEHAWAGESTFGELMNALVGDENPPARKFLFQLTSPLVFHSQQKTQPLPLPDLFFGSLLEKWNAFAPMAMPAEVRRYAETMVAISRFDLESRAAHMKAGGLRVGSVGKVQFSALNSDRYWLGMLNTLAGFAQFSGAGAGTTQGLGQVKAIPR